MTNPVAKALLYPKIGRLVKEQARRNKEIIYGAQAIKHQIFLPLSRPTRDWDVLSRRPRRSALHLERTLDCHAMSDSFYTKEADHPGTWKVIDKGLDGRKGTDDDFGIADYTKITRPFKTNLVNGVRFVALSEVSKDKRRSLRHKEFHYRHEKDRDDLNRIKMGKWIRRMFKV